MTKLNTKKINNAKELIKEIHHNQKRISGDYVTDHLNSTYNILKSIGVKDEDTLCAALLHHSLDKNKKFENKIKKDYGDYVHKLVTDYHSISNHYISKVSPVEINKQLILQTYISIAGNLDLLLIRLADKAEGIKNTKGFPEKKRQKLAERALYIYAPISKLLGIGKLSRTLEEEGFKIQNPQLYKRLNSYKRKNYKNSNKIIKNFVKEIKEFLKTENIEPVEISFRSKHIYSMYRKMNKYKRPEWTLEQYLNKMHDIVAMRIILKDEEECYFVEDVLNTLFKQIHEQRNDYITNPKMSGYKSIHNAYEYKNIIIECQIKTKDMHETNEYGFASHAFYKYAHMFEEKYRNDPKIIKDLNYWFAKKPQIDLFKNNVYVFTPQGHIRKLPKGSTALDFAYSIHSDVGNKCCHCKINNRIKKLSEKLKNGDLVEITTRDDQRPNRDWLKIVKTNRAKTHIKKYLRD